MPRLNRLIHEPARLRILASLAVLDKDDEADFSYLQDLLGLTSGNLGAHLAKLEGAGYIHVEKTFVDRKPRTFLSMTRKGRKAFAEHVAALNAILGVGARDEGDEGRAQGKTG